MLIKFYRNKLVKGDGPMKRMKAVMIATFFLVSLLGCAAQRADKDAWDEMTQKTLKAEDDAKRQRKASGP